MSPIDLLSLAHAVYRCSEWRTAKTAQASAGSASWKAIYDICQDVDAYKAFQASHPGFAVSPEDEAAAAEIVAWAADRALASDASDSYARDLATAVESTEVHGGSFALVCSAAAAFRQQRDRHVSESHVSTVGVRDTFSLTLKKITTIAPKKKRFGLTYRLGFRDAEGNDIVWFSSRRPEALGIAIGRPCMITATVRRHDEYDGSKQTIVNRGKLVGQTGAASVTETSIYTRLRSRI